MICRDDKFVFYIEFEKKDWSFGRADAFREKMKAEVPQEARSYDDTSKLWTVDQNYRDVVRRIYGKHFTDERQESLF